ncbi:KipI antagonist [Mesobacillus campisalis]|uniref:KipI antagonist n=1 Tax=Mesobacillus campisalis TaxID=1408103 RepID=A0A0M2SST3_9BACI|nr:biotin-dependent carboxyltransferase family protein [Mesobacillus campisalis]KKK37198.1 KipI antagonist [Mesobacillus campisalis]
MLNIHKPGLLTTVQDPGRFGFQKYGVIVSGAMDSFALRIANVLVGNDENEAALEITLLGPEIEFTADALVSLCGGDLSPRVNGKSIRMWRPVFIEQGSVLSFGAANQGIRTYLAVAGGINVPPSLGSKSTYLRATLGGYCGRPLKTGDHVKVSSPGCLAKSLIKHLSQTLADGYAEADWAVSNMFSFPSSDRLAIRVIKGRHFDLFTLESKAAFFNEPFVITPQSDRMGYRLKGPDLGLGHPEEMLSEAVCYGTIQVPPGGQPIILLADRPATGGYPKIAEIASVDFPAIAQAKPGDHLFFELISAKQAQLLLLQKEAMLRQVKQGIQLKFREVKIDDESGFEL